MKFKNIIKLSLFFISPFAIAVDDYKISLDLKLFKNSINSNQGEGAGEGGNQLPNPEEEINGSIFIQRSNAWFDYMNNNGLSSAIPSDSNSDGYPDWQDGVNFTDLEGEGEGLYLDNLPNQRYPIYESNTNIVLASYQFTNVDAISGFNGNELILYADNAIVDITGLSSFNGNILSLGSSSLTDLRPLENAIVNSTLEIRDTGNYNQLIPSIAYVCQPENAGIFKRHFGSVSDPAMQSDVCSCLDTNNDKICD